MTSKQITILAGVLVLAAGIGFVATQNRHTPTQNIAGTIGAAQRYQSQQISDQDVKLTDQQVQSFLQSDTFHKMATNPEFRKQVVNGEVAKVGSVEGASLLIRQEGAFLRTNDVANRFMNDTQLSKLPADAGFRQYIDALGHNTSLWNDAAALVRIGPGLRVITETGLATTLSKDAAARQMIGSDNFIRVIDSQAISHVGGDANFSALVDAFLQRYGDTSAKAGNDVNLSSKGDAAAIAQADAALQRVLDSNSRFETLAKSTDMVQLRKDGLAELLVTGFGKMWESGLSTHISDVQSICKSAEAKAALQDEALMAICASDAGKVLFQTDAFHSFVTDAAMKSLATNGDFQAIMRSEAMSRAMGDVAVRGYMNDVNLRTEADAKAAADVLSISRMDNNALQTAVEAANKQTTSND